MQIVASLVALAFLLENAAAQTGQGPSAGTSVTEADPQRTLSDGAAVAAGLGPVRLSIDIERGKARLGYRDSRSARFASAGDARRSCIRARGTFSHRAGRLACRNPRAALRTSTGDIVVTGTLIP